MGKRVQRRLELQLQLQTRLDTIHCLHARYLSCTNIITLVITLEPQSLVYIIGQKKIKRQFEHQLVQTYLPLHVSIEEPLET